MRFLAGLCVGATVTLGSAAWLLIERAHPTAAAAIEAISATAERAPTHRDQEPIALPDLEVIEEEPADYESLVFAADPPASVPDRPEPPAPGAPLPAVAEPPDPDPPTALPAPQPEGRVRTASSREDQSAGTPIDLPSAPAWQPFASERAARGFATRLAALLDRPLAVERSATRRYVVTFGYATDAEREQVLAEIAGLTRGVAL
jgi:hypothetical protein